VQTPVGNGCQALLAVEAREDERLLPAMEARENEPSFLSADWCEGMAWVALQQPSVVIVEQMEAEKLLL
jgi:hypothetical protein